LLLPLFFAISGLRTNVPKINDPITVGLLVLVFVMAWPALPRSWAPSSSPRALIYTMPFRARITLGPRLQQQHA
jgi:hypothetical protein